MSGKRQHFIPQFLQRGFICEKKDNQFYTWVFRKENKPFKANIEKIGIEKNFYTANNDYALDNSITDIEGQFVSMVSDICSQGISNKYSAEDISQLIAHLEIRTRHFRQNYKDSIDYIYQQIYSFLEDENKVNSYILNNYFNDPLKIIPYISHDLKELGFDDHAVFLFAKKVHLTFWKKVLENSFRILIILSFSSKIKLKII